MLELTEIHLKNFLSHTDTHIRLKDHKGLVLISGVNKSGLYDSNGSGKSTILEGILYSLTGDTLRGLKANDVVNRNAKKDTCTSLYFSTTEGSYKVERYRKDSLEGDNLKVWNIGGDVMGNISKRLNKDTQSMLDNIIDIPYDVLVNTIFLGEGLSSRFTQLSDPAKKSLIESTLNLSYDLSKSKDSASSKLKELKLLKSNLEGQQSMIESLLSLNIETVQEDLITESTELRDLQELKESLNNTRSKLEIEISALSPRLDLLRTSISQYESLDLQLRTLDTSVATLVTELTSVEKSEIPHCTLCKQKLSTQESIESLRESYKQKISEGMEQMRVWQSQLDALPNIEVMKSKLAQSIEDYNTKNSEYQSILSQITETVRLITTAESSIKNKEDLLNNHESHKNTLRDISTQLANLDEEIFIYEYLYKLFSPTGLVTVILEEAVSYINERIKAYTDILLDKTYQIELNKGKLSLVDSKGSTYQSLSNGEKRRLDIAIQFSLHDYTHIYCGIGTNLLFIDEVLDTLDATGVNNIIEVLNLKRSYCNLDSIYVITHNNELKSYFDEVITVVKDASGNSHIEN